MKPVYTWREVELRLGLVSHMYPRGVRVWLNGECRSYWRSENFTNQLAVLNHWPSIHAEDLFIKGTFNERAVG